MQHWWWWWWWWDNVSIGESESRRVGGPFAETLVIISLANGRVVFYWEPYHSSTHATVGVVTTGLSIGNFISISYYQL